MKIFKKIILFLLVLLVLIQLYPRPKKNIAAGIAANDINTVMQIDDSVLHILKTSCYDCHSDNTNYPWYSTIQPVSMWLGNHIREGKKELNFSQFATYSTKKKDHKLEEIAEQIEKQEMPLKSYSLLHADAKLSAEQSALIINWVKVNRLPKP